MTGSKQTAKLSKAEEIARDKAWVDRDSKLISVAAGKLWDECWMAARAHYAPGADEANALRERLGLTDG